MAFFSHLIHLLLELLGSMVSKWTLLTCLITLLIVKIVKYIQFQNRLPPGPRGVPFLGMLPFIKKEFHLTLFDFKEQYGKIFHMYMGQTPIVVISDHNMIKKAFAKGELAARPTTVFTDILGGYGVINIEGPLWKSQRSFLHKQKFGMKHWGTGSTQMEARVSQEVHYLLNSILAEKKSPFNPETILNCAISNVICSIVMSTRFHHDDPKFQRFMYLFNEGFRLFTTTGPLVFLPILKHYPGVNNTIEEIKKNRDEMLEFVRFIIQDHRDTFNPEAPRDLVDSYLMEMETAKEEGRNVFPECKDPETQLEQIILDLFSAGVETLDKTMMWAILHMLRNPTVCHKIQAELEQVVGKHRLPTLADMPSLHYTRASILEVMRRSTVVPTGVTHATTRTVEIEGHLIPKDSHVIPFLHGVHMDPELWDQPEEFKPERFINEEGKVQKPKHFMPFGAGQRMCLGDSLAEMELQLFFSSLLHVYDLESPADTPLPSLRGVAGATISPQSFEMSFVPRNVEALIISNAKSQSSKEAWSKHVRVYGSMHG